jgi:hypothetical protein
MRRERRVQIAFGGGAIAFYAVHAAVLAWSDGPQHLLWACHLGCLLVGIGLASGRAIVFAVGFFWLLIGTPLWIVNMATTGDVTATSFLTHGGGTVIAVAFLRRVTVPRGAWLLALAGLVALGAASRALTPAADNVNLSHAVWAGWERTFPSYPTYVLMLVAIAGAAFFAAERAAVWWGARVKDGGNARPPDGETGSEAPAARGTR